MLNRPKNLKKHHPSFKMPDDRPLGEVWHDKVLEEGVVKPVLVFTLAILTVLTIVTLFGGSGTQQARAEDPEKERFDNVAETVYVPEEKPAENPPEQLEEEDGLVHGEDVLEGYSVYEQDAPHHYEPVYEPVYQGSPEPGDLRFNGVESDGVYQYTWYSQNVLPGGGLDIPGRHVDESGYVRDDSGNIVVASSDLEKGTTVETPYGMAKVYDTGCAPGVLDVYTAW